MGFGNTRYILRKVGRLDLVYHSIYCYVKVLYNVGWSFNLKADVSVRGCKQKKTKKAVSFFSGNKKKVYHKEMGFYVKNKKV